MTKISQLSDLGGSLAAGDEFIVRDVSDISTPNKKVTASGFIDYVITQGVGSGFTQIAIGVGPQARVQCTSSGSDSEVIVTTSGVERARYTTAGQFRLASAGITFNGDTATANELDDYEEGTWTPNLLFGGVNVDMTYTTQRGTYTKIGNVVRFVCDIQLSAKGSSTGNATLGGFPFSINSTNGISVASTHSTITQDGKGPLLFLLASSTTAQLRGLASNSDYTDAAFGSSTIVRCTGTHQVS